MKLGNDPLGLSVGDMVYDGADYMVVLSYLTNYREYCLVKPSDSGVFVTAEMIERDFKVFPVSAVEQNKRYTDIEEFLEYVAKWDESNYYVVKEALDSFNNYKQKQKEEQAEVEKKVLELEALGYTVTKNK